MPGPVTGPGGAAPLVGVSSYLVQARWGPWDQRAALVPDTYVRWLRRAGNQVALLPPADPAAAGAALARVDALVVPGGPDVGPVHYGAAPDPHTRADGPERDHWELALVRAALAAGKPVLGICRGAQLLNVALGGGLEQHLPDRLGHTEHSGTPGRFGRHEVRTRPGTLLGRLLPGSVDVATYHHQAVGRLGRGLEAAAHSADDVIEAVELPGARFVLGVQWHPEADEDLRLARALAEAARGLAATG
ncbi:gamma-glutamyl-gamma-aminobutyrate hydrolase family protein [Streptomyces achromogenes]|uniref:gamma-glutamyl-gamma-aminobutyrate hydrolase family protein n=1 Tax=Streptomyces achromogenes TaxID=67255 RepID=UPI0036F7A3DD